MNINFPVNDYKLHVRFFFKCLSLKTRNKESKHDFPD